MLVNDANDAEDVWTWERSLLGFVCMNVYLSWPRASRKECRWRVWVASKMEVARGLAGTREALWGWFGGLIVMC